MSETSCSLAAAAFETEAAAAIIAAAAASAADAAAIIDAAAVQLKISSSLQLISCNLQLILYARLEAAASAAAALLQMLQLSSWQARMKQHFASKV